MSSRKDRARVRAPSGRAPGRRSRMVALAALAVWLSLVGPGLPRPEGLDGLLGEGEGAVFVAPPSDRELELFPVGWRGQSSFPHVMFTRR